jgi:isopentenyldiphosphate isomerase
MEYVDVLDSEGNSTGESKSRSQVHKDGDWHRMAFVWILSSNHELLIQKRSLQKDANPGRWDGSAGGHVESGETALQAARKELNEELGLNVQENELEYIFMVKAPVESGQKVIENQFQEVYLLKRDVDIDRLKLQPEEVYEVKFFPFKDLEKLINKKDGTFSPRYEHYSKLFAELHKRYG